MPIPSRKKDEDKNKFMTRCMNDPNVQKEFQNNEQRVAVCMSKALDGVDYIESASFQIAFKEQNFKDKE